MGINDQMATGTATSKSPGKSPALEPLESRLLLDADLTLAADATLQLGAEQHLTAGGAEIQVAAYSVPVLADWNADGRPDLLVGEKSDTTSGKVRVYLNTGTAAAPVYAPFFRVQAAGSDLTVPAAPCLGAYPRVHDWNQDGKKDLLIGLGDGTIRLYLNTGTAANPAFGTSSTIQAGPAGAKVAIDVGDRAAFDVADWNEDGAVDLVVGALDGKIRVYQNRRATGEPDLNSPIVVQEAGVDLQVPSGRSSVDVCDFNGDGRKDLVVGNTDAQVVFYANQGTNAAPAFGNHETLVAIAGGSRSRPYVADFNADGIPDVLVGDADGLVHCFLGEEASNDERIGYATVFENVSTVPNRRAVPVVAGGTGTLKSMSIYHQGGSGHVILAIYADEAGKPGARLGITDSTLINSAKGWQTIALQDDVAVTPGQTIWLAWVFEKDPGLRWRTDSPGRAISSATWSGGMPDRFGTAQTEVNAVYSVYATYNQQVEATVGYSTVFPNISAVTNRRAMPVTMQEDGILESLTMYHQGGTGHAVLAVYNDASGLPGSRLGATASTLINSTQGWQTFDLQNPVTVAAGQTIWLAWVFENDPGMRWTAGLPGRAMSPASWSGGMPQSFGTATTTTGYYSIYATYRIGADVTAPGAVSGLTAVAGNGQISLSWTNPDDADFAGVKVVRKQGGNPTSPTDGTMVYSGTAQQYTNTGLTNGTTYYYAVFSFDEVPNYSNGVTVHATPAESAISTVGYTTVFPKTSGITNRRAQPVVAGQAGTLVSISIYHRGGTGRAILAVYSDASGLPGTLLGATASTLINSTEGWQTIALQSPVTVSAGQTIWLAWVFENDPGMRWTEGLPGRAMSPTGWSGGMPQSFGAATTTTGYYSIYATYGASSETPGEVIVDNTGAGTSSTGVWYASSRPGPYGTNSMTTTGAGSTFTFSADLTPGVAYAIYSWWTSGPLRYTTVPYEIRSGSTLLDTVTVNQTLNGSQWNLLGIYVFSGTARVTLSADPASTASVNADAIRFVPVAPQSTEVTIDNLGAGASSVGSWYVSGGPNPWGANSMVTWTPGETFTFTANLVSGKSYAVYAWWTESSCRYTAVPYQILNNGAVLDTVAVNQTGNGGKWNLLGTYTFTGAASVVIRSAPSSAYSTNADAVRFVPVA